MARDQENAALAAIVAAARRSAVAGRLQGDVEERLLRSIVDATATIFDAEAASIALFEPDPDRLEFRVAAGARGAGAIGLSVKPTQGIAGFVFSSGQALALSDVANDPRFDRATAERTGYVPRSIAAVPLTDEQGTVGVLQVLDKRASATFSLRDMELIAVFAGQATAAIRAARVQRSTVRLLAEVLAQLDPEADEAAVEALVARVTRSLDVGDDDPFWRLVEQVAALRAAGPNELAIVAEVLEVLARHASAAGRRRR